MKLILSIVIIGILILSAFGTGTFAKGENEIFLTEKICFSKPEIIKKENFISLELPEANSNYWETAKPFLPAVSRIFTFPFGTKIKNVKVTLSNRISQKITKPIEPTPEIETISDSTFKKPIEISYSDFDTYPKEQFSWKTTAGKNGKDHVILCSISINPVYYNFKENTISYYQNAYIKINYILPTSPINFPDEYDLLILTPTEFASTLQRFVDHKEGRNIRTKLVTLDEIPLQGIDIQESIKYYIRESIETWGVDYLILVGSGLVGEAKFPFRYAWIGDQYEDFFPSDLYYADIYNDTMGFPSWDYDKDGKFAEYPDDILSMDIAPDIFLGKIPCDSIDELNSYIDKVIWYDNNNKMTNKVVLVGGDTFPGDDGVYEGEYANTVVLDKLPNYSSIKLWGSRYTLSKLTIKYGYSKCPDFFDFSGHGDIDCWATHPPKNNTIWLPKGTIFSSKNGWYYFDFDRYLISNEKKYPIVFYNSCSNNKFTDLKDCLSWKTIGKPNGGGIIAFGASGTGKAALGTHITERVFGWMEVHTFDELYLTKNLGEVWSNCISDYYNTFQASLSKNDYKTMVEFSMFGDPTLNAIDGKEPKLRYHISSQSKVFEIIIDFLTMFERLMSYFNNMIKYS